MKVIDSSALIKYFSREEGWEKVEEHILEGATTLDLAIKEVANALWRKILKEEMETHQAKEILEDLIKAQAIKIIPQNTLIAEALELAIKHHTPIYDTLFITLAKKLKTTLITSDTKQGSIAQKEEVKTIIV